MSEMTDADFVEHMQDLHLKCVAPSFDDGNRLMRIARRCVDATEVTARLIAERDALANDRDGYVQVLTDNNNKLRAQVDAAAEMLREVKARNADISAWQCVYTDGKTGLVGDEHGNQYCAMSKMVEALRAEIERLRADLRAATMSDTEYCAEIERINKALIAAPTVDIDVVVPDRDYSAMTPRDCYEAGLLDGVYQAREAIKAASRAAQERK